MKPRILRLGWLAALSPILCRCQAEAPSSPSVHPAVAAPPALKGVTVALDPGHGGRHTGFVGPTGLCEKDVTLAVAVELRQILEGWGARVVMTRGTDTDFSDDPLSDVNARVDLINRENPTLCLAIHALGLPHQRSARGFQVRVTKTTGPTEAQNRALGRLIRSELTGMWGSHDLGTRYESLGRGLKGLDCPAALVEVETITNPSVEPQLKERSTRQQVAAALARAIQRWLKGETE
jgi:N-acetylmuramoyl-L-alanine amidase